MDVAVALVVVFSLLSTASYFVIKKSQDPFPALQLVRTGSDITKIMDYQGYFDDPSGTEIENYLEDILPVQYEMFLEGSGENSNCDFSAGAPPPEDKPIGVGKEFFVTSTKDFCSLRYKIWVE
jgi:hypothetical protein